MLERHQSIIAININVVLANMRSELKFTKGFLIHRETEAEWNEIAFPSY